MPVDFAAFKKYEKMSPFEIKDKLASLAKESSKKSALTLLNAGRGNPNWVATTPRESFFLLGQFAIEESKRVMDLPDIGGMPAKEGCARRLEAYCAAHKDQPGAKFLEEAVRFAIMRFNFNPDAFVHELTDSIIGDQYPVPDRMLVHAEAITHEYLMWAMCGNPTPKGKFDLYAVEGGTAAMCYVFKTLMTNKILHRGDTIALGTPIFTPYLEMPHLAEYNFKIVEIHATQENAFQFSDEELKKLEDPKIKMFFICNPGNPSSVATCPEVGAKLVDLVKTKRPDLLILTDDVYGTFVEGFRSLMADLPYNTIGVYSFSKYFGCTGWRLGVIALHENNKIDEMLANLPAKDRDDLIHRYTPISLNPEKVKFIDRIVADSRDVALNHTAGLSLPQQVQMILFSLFQLADTNLTYQKSCMKIVNDRLKAMNDGLGFEYHISPLYAAYYAILDFEFWMRKYAGDDVVEFMKKNFHPFDLIYRLAANHAIVLLNGSGFEAPDWSVRVSLANLTEDVYDDIGRAVREVARAYGEAYHFSKGSKAAEPAKTNGQTPKKAAAKAAKR